MRKITFNTYLEDIKAKYELEKTKEYSKYLSDPTPGSIQELVYLLKNSDLTALDKKILNSFLESEKFDIDKFRPICNFFVGRTKIPKRSIVDVMALLVDFQPRPLGSYLENNTNENLKKSDESGKPKIATPPQEHPTEPSKNILLSFKYWIRKNKLLSATVSLLIIISSFATIKTFTKENECMQWEKDHYEEVNCDEVSKMSQGIMSQTVINPKEEYLLNHLKKIEPCDTTTYFRNGKACIWYWKTPDDKLDCFTAPGFHPVNGKNLRPITQHMIDKYILSE